MVAIRATFDGEKIVVPDALRGCPPQDIIVIFQGDNAAVERFAWFQPQEASFAKAWDNDEDAVYDQM